jgi:hypothetical protein
VDQVSAVASFPTAVEACSPSSHSGYKDFVVY